MTLLEGRATIHGIYDPSPYSVEAAKRVYAQFVPGGNLVVYDSLEAACNDAGSRRPGHRDAELHPHRHHRGLRQNRASTSCSKNRWRRPSEMPTRSRRSPAAYPAIFQVGLQYRYKPIYVEAIHEALERGSVGDIKTISILEHRLPFLDKVNQWNKFSKYSGGTLVEKCCHYFDLMNLFARSRPRSVYASGSQAVNFLDFEYGGEKSDILDNAFVIVEYENGVRASFNLCMFSPMFYEEMVLCGDLGRLKVWENEDFLPEPRMKAGLELTTDGRSRRAPACRPTRRSSRAPVTTARPSTST